ncbi:MAG: hypothetical protein JWO46_660 [Nocardioidaceae bacterium]|nr:hypothetical protein [Nocardioidaceae bacterium]
MSAFARGETALIAPVSSAEPVVGAARAAHDTSAAYGVPAHVTVLVPWLPIEAVDDAVRAELTRIVASVRAFDVLFREVRRFGDGAAWLAPEPETPFRQLTERVAARWPDRPPYGGAHDDVVPHLTIAESHLEEAEAMVTPGLPFTHHCDRVDLIGFDGARWERVASFALG